MDSLFLLRSWHNSSHMCTQFSHDFTAKQKCLFIGGDSMRRCSYLWLIVIFVFVLCIFYTNLLVLQLFISNIFWQVDSPFLNQNHHLFHNSAMVACSLSEPLFLFLLPRTSPLLNLSLPGFPTPSCSAIRGNDLQHCISKAIYVERNQNEKFIQDSKNLFPTTLHFMTSLLEISKRQPYYTKSE